MACPLCRKFYCDHTAAERGETQNEVMADAIYGSYKDTGLNEVALEAHATECLKEYKQDGLKTATSLVGEKKAKEILARV